jgi:DNA topoisomerase-2
LTNLILKSNFPGTPYEIVFSFFSNFEEKQRMSNFSEEKYRRHTLRDHIYEVPDTYIGSDEKIPRNERVLEFSLVKKFSSQMINIPEGVERIFLEILSNAGDNVQRSRESNVPIGKIDVKIEEQRVTIRNEGNSILLEIHSTENVYIPEMIFGTLLTSSNYHEERTGAGRNGYGAKLCNIFSVDFFVIIVNSGKKYFQKWTDNMRSRFEPILSSINEKDFVEISYILDFERFRMEKKYDLSAIFLFAKHVADTGFTCRVPVFFNGTPLPVRNIVEYSKLLYPNIENYLVHYEWPSGISLKIAKIGKSKIQIPETETNLIPEVELAILDTPNEGSKIAFVNGIQTRDGGVHVDSAMKNVTDSILETFGNMNEKTSGDSKTNKKLSLSPSDVKRHLTIIISCRLRNPKFTSQQKTKLSSPKPKIHIDSKNLKQIEKWDILSRLNAEIEAKQFRILSKTDGKKRKHISVKDLEDANLAGTKDSEKCTLILVEGKSAMGYAARFISLISRGRDIYGIYPLRGKPLNTMKADFLSIVQNREICEIKDALGLREGVDYSNEDLRKTLRYGQIIIFADSDVDGKHIIGLILNIFFCRFPSLIAIGFIKFLRTRIVSVTKGNTKLSFFTNSEYEKWRESITDISKWKHKYYKGLGSSSNKEIKEEFDLKPRIVSCIYDNTTPSYMSLAFSDKQTNARKKWIASLPKYTNIEKIEMLPISYFLNFELVTHSIDNMKRCIPGFDGLKISQRKVIWASMGWKKLATSTVKVSQLAAHVSEKTGYHHGEKSLCDAISHMAMKFVGVNNLPLLVADGQFGTRNMMGEDGADARYKWTKPEWWWEYVFSPFDNHPKNPPPYLVLTSDEGETHEPVTFLPIVPLHMINGVNGIGTGWSTFIPCFSPFSIID